MKIELNETNIKIICKLNYFFNDFKKVIEWLEAKNPNFGDISPRWLMKIGKEDNVLQFIETSLEENNEVDSSASLNATNRLGW